MAYACSEIVPVPMLVMSIARHLPSNGGGASSAARIMARGAGNVEPGRGGACRRARAVSRGSEMLARAQHRRRRERAGASARWRRSIL